MLKLSCVWIQVVELFQRAAKVSPSITPLHPEQREDSNKDAASTLIQDFFFLGLQKERIIIIN